MSSRLQSLKTHQNDLLKLLPIIAFAVPLLWLYLLEPATFEAMWKGRTFQLFFIWLIALELILGWETLQAGKLQKLASAKTAVFITSLLLPTLYVVASYYWGLNGAITNWAAQSHIQWANSMPLSIEYLAFAAMFGAIVYLSFGFKGLKAFSVPAFFLVIVGAIYTIDNVFPYGQFTPFQIFVPTTTTLAAAILNLMGYTTSITYAQNMPYLTATDPNSLASATFSIAWPCAGIESFLIFTVVILLFLKRMPISLKSKVGYFAFGAAVTYFLNSLRIVNIFMAGMVYGENSVQVQNIHFYYGPLYAVAWIVMYPILILVTQSLWRKIRKTKQAAATEGQPASPNPA
ncbi:MAG: archaeosortase/exosortase family protein [Candidatus Bathyarchaeota archaeon]|nr:archaeosortase/exosortase family protein [Candidatus Bathyarchaeota archaeon]